MICTLKQNYRENRGSSTDFVRKIWAAIPDAGHVVYTITMARYLCSARWRSGLVSGKWHLWNKHKTKGSVTELCDCRTWATRSRHSSDWVQWQLTQSSEPWRRRCALDTINAKFEIRARRRRRPVADGTSRRPSADRTTPSQGMTWLDLTYRLLQPGMWHRRPLLIWNSVGGFQIKQKIKKYTAHTRYPRLQWRSDRREEWRGSTTAIGQDVPKYYTDYRVVGGNGKITNSM